MGKDFYDIGHSAHEDNRHVNDYSNPQKNMKAKRIA
jgi:hypothetical protein